MKRGGAQTQQGADQQKKSREEEKAYKDALRRIPNQKPADPGARSIGCDYSTFPGLRMPFGSSVRLSVFISS